ncbi:MAG TPA: DUF1173 family protein [Burkholderiaceae bacterium]|nr:DUF1173 family protein [Burkholderiaceae bacterium]
MSEQAAALGKSDVPVYFIKGGTFRADDEALQAAIGAVYEGPERPCCMCKRGGVPMYVAKYDTFVVKRLPDTGREHSTACYHYELPPAESGRGELIGTAIVERAPDDIDLKFDFPLERMPGRSIGPAATDEASEVSTGGRRMSLRGLLHYMWAEARFNCWTPAMEGKRSWPVLHHHLTLVLKGKNAKGRPVADVIYVPESFAAERKTAIAAARRKAFSRLTSAQTSVQQMVVVGELKATEQATSGERILIKHMPDCPLLMDKHTWDRFVKVFKPLFDARATDEKLHLVVACLVYSAQESVFRIDRASMMLTTGHWIPVEGTFEVPLIRALVDQHYRFEKPLRFDAKSAAPFANVVLKDSNQANFPLDVISAHAPEAEQEAKARYASERSKIPWIWRTDEPIPPLPWKPRSAIGAAALG